MNKRHHLYRNLLLDINTLLECDLLTLLLLLEPRLLHHDVAAVLVRLGLAVEVRDCLEDEEALHPGQGAALLDRHGAGQNCIRSARSR